MRERPASSNASARCRRYSSRSAEPFGRGMGASIGDTHFCIPYAVVNSATKSGATYRRIPITAALVVAALVVIVRTTARRVRAIRTNSTTSATTTTTTGTSSEDAREVRAYGLNEIHGTRNAPAIRSSHAAVVLVACVCAKACAASTTKTATAVAVRSLVGAGVAIQPSRNRQLPLRHVSHSHGQTTQRNHRVRILVETHI